MRVAVTGSSGLLGRAVCSHLESRGGEVWRIDRTFEQGAAWDLSNTRDVAIALGGLESTDAIVHLAGKRLAVAEQRSKGADLLFTNLRIDLNVLEVARARKIPGVYASTVSVYPEYPVGAEMYPYSGCRESDANAFPAESVRYSAFGKMAAERMIEAMAEQNGLCWSIVRLVNTYGPHDTFGRGALVIPALIQRALSTPTGNPFPVYGADNERDFLYVDDAAAGIVAALDAALAGHTTAIPPSAKHTTLPIANDTTTAVYNLGTGRGERIGDVARKVLRACGVSCKLEYEDGGVTGASRKVVDPSKARAELGWEAKVSLEDGIQRTVDWYREHVRSVP